jgi:hypothetical protein
MKTRYRLSFQDLLVFFDLLESEERDEALSPVCPYFSSPFFQTDVASFFWSCCDKVTVARDCVVKWVDGTGESPLAVKRIDVVLGTFLVIPKL